MDDQIVTILPFLCHGNALALSVLPLLGTALFVAGWLLLHRRGPRRQVARRYVLHHSFPTEPLIGLFFVAVGTALLTILGVALAEGLC